MDNIEDMLFNQNSLNNLIQDIQVEYEYSKIFNFLFSFATKHKNNLSLITSEKNHQELIQKVIFRNGKIDDLFRAYLLYDISKIGYINEFSNSISQFIDQE